MTDTKFTPGPWISDADHSNTWHPNISSAVDSNIFAGNICTVLSNLIYPGNDPKMHVEMKANAQLIAAAPELYAALDLALSHMSEPDCVIWRDIQSRAKSALAKARGETQ